MNKVNFWKEGAASASKARKVGVTEDSATKNASTEKPRHVAPESMQAPLPTIVSRPGAFVNTHILNNMPFSATRNQGLLNPFRCIDYAALARINGFGETFNNVSYLTDGPGAIGAPLVWPHFLVSWFPGQMSPSAERIMSPGAINETSGMCLGVNGSASGTVYLIAGTTVTFTYRSTPDCRKQSPMQDSIFFTFDRVGGSELSRVNSYFRGDEQPTVKGTAFSVAPRPLSLTNPIRADMTQTINVQYDWCFADIYIQHSFAPFVGLRVVVLPPPEGPCVS